MAGGLEGSAHDPSTAQAQSPGRVYAGPVRGLPRALRRRPLLVVVGLVFAASAVALMAARLNATATTLVWASAA